MASAPTLALTDNSMTSAPSPQKLHGPGELESLAKKLERDRYGIEIGWKLNLAFYRGNQYSYYSKTRRQITSLPVDEGDKPRYRARIVANQIMPGCQSLLAKYTKTKPVMHATPASGSDTDLKAAQLADRLLEYEWEELSLDEQLRDAVLWSFVGQGYWYVCYDEHAGKQLNFVIGPDGSPILDDGVVAAFREQADQLGFEVREVSIYVGDIQVSVISPFDLLLDPTARCFEECKYVIHTKYMSPDAVYDKWGVKLAPDAVAAAPDSELPIQPSGNLQQSQKNVCRIRCGYFLPTKSQPKGRVVEWSKQLADCLEDGPWQYPTNQLPFVKFSGNPIPGQLYDQGVIQQAIPLQKELNKTLSQIIEQKNMTIRPQWMSPRGSMQGVRMTNEPGANWEFTPIAGMRPEPIQMPSIPNYVFAHLQEIKQRIADVFGLNEVMQGQVPPNVEAGIAIDLLQEMATDRLAPGIRSMEHTLADAARLILEYAKTYYSEPRLMRIRGGSGGSQTQVKRFVQSDLSGAVDVRVEAGSGLPRTRAGRQARVEWMMQMNLIQPEYAYKYLDTADMVGAADLLQLDEDQQLREIEMMIQGRPFNQVAQQKAGEAAQQGINPDPSAQGQQLDPSTPPDQVQKLVEDQGYAPGTFDNHSVHLDVTARFMKGIEYLALSEDVQARILDHAEDHMDIMTHLPSIPTGIPPRVSLQLKGAVGPSTAADILHRSGVMTDAQTIGTEEPLDTWVTNSVDKPNAEQGPGSPFTAQQAAQQAQQAQQQQQQQQAQQQQQDQQQSQAQLQQTQQLQQMQQSAEQHNQSQQHAAEAHQQKMRESFQKMAQARAQAKAQAKAGKRG